MTVIKLEAIKIETYEWGDLAWAEDEHGVRYSAIKPVGGVWYVDQASIQHPAWTLEKSENVARILNEEHRQ